MAPITYWLLLISLQSVASVWDVSEYEVFRSSPLVPLKKKLNYGASMDDYHCGAKVNVSSLEYTGLVHVWCRNPVVNDGYTYLIKRYARDMHSPPVSYFPM